MIKKNLNRPDSTPEFPSFLIYDIHQSENRVVLTLASRGQFCTVEILDSGFWIGPCPACLARGGNRNKLLVGTCHATRPPSLLL